MKRPALILACLTTTALACPVKSGFFADGAFKDTTGLTPLCTPAFKKLAAGVKPGEYGELYRTPSDGGGPRAVARAVALMAEHGWKGSGVQTRGEDQVYTFKKAGNQTVIAVRTQPTYLLVVVIGDR